MSRSIYSPENYHLSSSPYRFWRFIHQTIARFFPPDWVYLVWFTEAGGSQSWLAGAFLYEEDAEAEVQRFSSAIPGRQAESERRPLRGG